MHKFAEKLSALKLEENLNLAKAISAGLKMTDFFKREAQIVAVLFDLGISQVSKLFFA